MNELADLKRSLLGTGTTARGFGAFRDESPGGKYRSMDGTTWACNGKINSIKDKKHDNPQKAQTGCALSFKLEQSIILGVEHGIRPAQRDESIARLVTCRPANNVVSQNVEWTYQ
jgi:hypothetical protein